MLVPGQLIVFKGEAALFVGAVRDRIILVSSEGWWDSSNFAPNGRWAGTSDDAQEPLRAFKDGILLTLDNIPCVALYEGAETYSQDRPSTAQTIKFFARFPRLRALTHSVKRWL